MADFESADSGWYNDGASRKIWVKSGERPVSDTKTFTVTLEALPCTSEYRTISMPGEDNGWNPADPARSLGCMRDKVWTGVMQFCGGAFKFAADESWIRNWGSDGSQDGPNFAGLPEVGSYQVTFDEANPASPDFQLIDANPGLCGVSAEFVCENGYTNWGTGVYVVGNVPPLGEWNPANGKQLDPNGPYPTWTNRTTGLPPETDIEWKCIKRLESGGPPEWQPGENNRFRTPATGDAGRQVGRL